MLYRAVVPNLQATDRHFAANLQVYWWWNHLLSGYVIGRFFPWKHCCVHRVKTGVVLKIKSIIGHSRAAVQLSSVDRSAVTRRFRTTAWKGCLGHQQCSPLCV